MSTVLAVANDNEVAMYADMNCVAWGISERTSKVGALPDHRLAVGWTGTMEAGLAFCNRLANFSEDQLNVFFNRYGETERLAVNERDKEDFTALIIDAYSMIWTCSENMIPIHRYGLSYAALGSGSHYAYGALANGALPLEALRIAAKFDVNTRAPFERVTPNSLEKERFDEDAWQS